MYKVIKYFTDLQDKNHAYNVGDTYPREGREASKDRIAELAGSDNKQKTPLIAEAKKEETLTVAQLKEKLAELNIEFKANATKPELEALLAEAEAKKENAEEKPSAE